MRIIADLHTHSIASSHAYSTVDELCLAAARRGLSAIALTDHAPGMPDSPHLWHFTVMYRLPLLIHGVRMLRGVELNISDTKGTVDLPDKVIASLDFSIASMHEGMFPPSTSEAHTEAWLAIIENPLVDCLGHPAKRKYPIDIDVVVRACRDKGTLMEINEPALRGHKEDYDMACEIALACMKYDVPVTVSSDAHTCYELGDCRRSYQMLGDIGFPKDLVVNASVESMREYFIKRKHRDIFPEGGDESAYWD